MKKALVSGEKNKSIFKLFIENFAVLKDMVGTVEVEEHINPNEVEELRKSIDNIEKMEEKHLNFEKTIKEKAKGNQKKIKVETPKMSNNKKVKNKELDDLIR